MITKGFWKIDLIEKLILAYFRALFSWLLFFSVYKNYSWLKMNLSLMPPTHSLLWISKDAYDKCNVKITYASFGGCSSWSWWGWRFSWVLKQKNFSLSDNWKQLIKTEWFLVKYFSSSDWSFVFISFSEFSSSDKELENLAFSLL